MYNLSGVVLQLIILNVIMFLISMFFFGNGGAEFLMLHFPTSEGFRPYQIVSHMFMHAGPLHLLFNMMALAYIGPSLERYWGAQKFLFYYLSCGIGSFLFAFGMNYLMWYLFGKDPYSVSLGASGAVMGLLMAGALITPDRQISLIFPPITLKLKVMVPLIMIIEWFISTRGISTGIGHFAHLGGAFTGLIMIGIWRKFYGRH